MRKQNFFSQFMTDFVRSKHPEYHSRYIMREKHISNAHYSLLLEYESEHRPSFLSPVIFSIDDNRSRNLPYRSLDMDYLTLGLSRGRLGLEVSFCSRKYRQHGEFHTCSCQKRCVGFLLYVSLFVRVNAA